LSGAAADARRPLPARSLLAFCAARLVNSALSPIRRRFGDNGSEFGVRQAGQVLRAVRELGVLESDFGGCLGTACQDGGR